MLWELQEFDGGLARAAFELWGGWAMKSAVSMVPFLLCQACLASLFVGPPLHDLSLLLPYKCLISSLTFFCPCLCWGNKSPEGMEFRLSLYSKQPAATRWLWWIRLMLLHACRSALTCVVGVLVLPCWAAKLHHSCSLPPPLRRWRRKYDEKEKKGSRIEIRTGRLFYPDNKWWADSAQGD